jgi:hypothetical protein
MQSTKRGPNGKAVVYAGGHRTAGWPKVPLNIMWRQANYRAAAAAIHKGEEAGKGMGGTLLY